MSDSANWLTETIRCTVFPVDPEAVLPDWEAIAGAAPETRKGQPRLGLINESGAWGDGGGQLVMETIPGRTHLRVSYNVDDGPEVPTLGAAVAELRAFDQSWLLALPQLSRIAFGTVLLQPIASREEGYGLLDKYMSAVSVDPGGSQDFLYRINRPRVLDLGEGCSLPVNRMSTWSVRSMEGLLLTGGGGQPKQLQTVRTRYHLRLELDINTTPEAADRFPTDAAQVVGVFDRLVDLADEIANEGDIA